MGGCRLRRVESSFSFIIPARWTFGWCSALAVSRPSAKQEFYEAGTSPHCAQTQTLQAHRSGWVPVPAGWYIPATHTAQANMADTPEVEKPVFDIYPDSAPEQEPQRKDRRTSIADISHHARPRPYHIPRNISHSYPAFKVKQECALKIGMQDFQEEMGKSTGVSYLEMIKDKLTIHRNGSQSKLSQQELADLQKATHFDKKELQQWYKGMC